MPGSTSHRLKTHTQSATAYRGFGGPQGMVGIERVMDHIAHALGAIRWRCGGEFLCRPGRNQTAKPQTTPYGMPVEDFVLQS